MKIKVLKKKSIFSIPFSIFKLIKPLIKYLIWMRTELVLFAFAFCFFLLNIPFIILTLMVSISPLCLYSTDRVFFDDKISASSLVHLRFSSRQHSFQQLVN